MSSWSEIRSRSGDPLSDTISDLITRANMSEAITDQITISDKISHVKVLRSKIRVSDKDLFSVYSRQRSIDSRYYMPFEPDGNKVRIDLKFDHGGEYLTDYSYQGNQAEIGFDTTLPVIMKNPEDDGITPGELCSVLDGLQHYYRAPITPYNSIKKMVTDAVPGLSITVRVWIISAINEAASSLNKRANLFYFIENDQIDYACKSEVDSAGRIHFFIKTLTNHYHTVTPTAQISIEDVADFQAPDFEPTDYDVGSGIYTMPEPQQVAFMDFTFTFNFSTKVIQIYKNGVLQIQSTGTVYNTVNSYPGNVLIPNNKMPFPPAFADPPPPPPVGTPTQQPFVEVMNQSVANGAVKINKITTSAMTKIYDVAGGTPVADPFSVKYDVPEGSGGTSIAPVSDIYLLAGQSSTGQIVFDDDEYGYAQYIRTTGSNLYNKKPTEIQLWLNALDNPVGGNAFLAIIKPDGTYIKFGAAIPVSGIPDAWTSYTRQGNLTSQYTTVVGSGIGVIWEGATGGTLNVRRGGSGSYEDVTLSCQNGVRLDSEGVAEWKTPNPSWNMAGQIKIGGETIGTSPWITIDKSNQLIVGEVFSSGSNMFNNAPTKAEFKIKKKAATTGTLYLQIVTAAGATKATLKTWDIATEPSITTTDPAVGVLNLVWTDVLNTVTIASGERLCLLTPASGTGSMNTGGELYVMCNVGNNTPTTDVTKNYNTTSSYMIKRNSAGTWATIDTSYDLTGKISIGGNDFTGYIHLNDIRKRTGIKADLAPSSFILPAPGKKVSQVIITAKAFGTPAAGAIYCRIRNEAGDLLATIGQRDISEVLGTDTSLTFTNVDNIYPMVLNDQVSIEYDNGTATNYLMIRTNKNAFEAADTILFEANVSNMAAALPVTDRDLAAQVFTGGVIDVNARQMRGLKTKANSALLTKPVTEARLMLKRTGTFGGAESMAVKIIRGLDKITVATLGTKLINNISSLDFVEYAFQNTGNSYSFAEDDYLGIECAFGNSTDTFIEARISTTDIYDTTKTIMFEYNGTTYTEVPTPDLTAKLYTGGFMVFPDPNIPVEPTPFHHYHGWTWGASTTPDSEALVKPELLKPEAFSYLNAILKQFRLYAMILTPQQIVNYFENRFTISGITFGEIEVVGNDISGFD